MSNIEFTPTPAGIELTTDEQTNLAHPSWLAEALLLGEYWRCSGLLDRLQTEVRVQRGRMGTYEVCDFVLLLLAYAVSGLTTLRLFFEQLKSVQSVLMAVWQRQRCPVASTLSRFLGDIDASALEHLRTLFESDLLAHGMRSPQIGGMLDRCGQRYWVFDVDGTHQATRQRSLVSTSDYPDAQRRSQVATAKGYLGRARGETIRTRSVVSQAHTSEWLGTFGAVGNGTPGADLERICGVITHYLHHHQVAGAQAIVRLDGYYGTPSFINQLQQHQFGYILRSRDYALLEHPVIQARLQTTAPQEWSHPESHQVRSVFDVGVVTDEWAGYTLPFRLIVVRTPVDPKRPHRVGKRMGEFIYELFVTSHAPTGLRGPDILSLYYGRGGFEKVLADEDQEGDCDRWCSWNPAGQEFWQILCQWVWNWRVWTGVLHHAQPLRQTLWAPAQEPPQPAALPAAPMEASLPLSEANATRPPIDSTEHGPMQLSQSWARNRGKFSGNDFNLLDNRTLQCPAGHSMYRRETRQNRRGDLLILFGLNPRICQECPLKKQCLAEGSKGTGGRRVTVIRKKLASSSKTVPSPQPPNPRSESLPLSLLNLTATTSPSLPPLGPLEPSDSGAELPLSLLVNQPMSPLLHPTEITSLTPPLLSSCQSPLCTLPLFDPTAESFVQWSPTQPAVAASNQPVLWLDLPATRLRRDLCQQLQLQQIVIHPLKDDFSSPEPNGEWLTRDQRAHRRLSWRERWQKNAATQAILHWRVQLFGIPSAILDWLHRLKPAAVIT